MGVSKTTAVVAPKRPTAPNAPTEDSNPYDPLRARKSIGLHWKQVKEHMHRLGRKSPNPKQNKQSSGT